MTSPQRLADRTRLQLADLRVPFYERFTGSGSGTRFKLKSVPNIETLYLYRLGEPEVLLEEGTEFSVHRDSGTIVFPTPPPAGETFVAEGEHAQFFSEEQIATFVQTAFDLHTDGRNPKLSYSSLPPREELLVAILAQIEGLWVLKMSSAYQIDIHAPEGMYIPRSQRFQQLNVILQELEKRYKELSGALGVGLYAVEMFNLRRVSRWTGRYVPTYIDREFDDTRPPQRVLPNISAQGMDLPDPVAATYHLTVIQGRAFEEELQLQGEDGGLLDLTQYTDAKATLFLGRYTVSMPRVVLPNFETFLDPATATVRITLSIEDTKRLQSSGNYVWSLVLTDEDGELPLIEGEVRVVQSVPLKSVNVTLAR